MNIISKLKGAEDTTGVRGTQQLPGLHFKHNCCKLQHIQTNLLFVFIKQLIKQLNYYQHSQ